MIAWTLALVAAWATALAHVLGKDCLRQQDLTAFVLLRLLAATLASSLLLLADPTTWSRFDRLDGPTVLALAGCGLLCPLAVNLALFAAYRRLPVNVGVPVFQIHPVWIAILTPWLLPQASGPTGLAGVVIIACGVVLVAVGLRPAPGASRRLDPWGLAAALVAALLNALAVIAWTALQDRCGSVLICASGTATASLALLPWVLWRRRHIAWGDRRARLGAAASGILVFALGNACAIHAARDLAPAAVFAVVSSAVLWTALIARWRLRERWTGLQCAGAVGIVLGAVVLI
jgi:drug/metabolite transporter (DMT)-like permease